MSSPILTFFILIIIQINLNYAINSNISVEQICDNSKDSQKLPISFKDLNEIKNVLSEFNLNKEKCSEEFHESLIDLNELLLNETLLNDICTLEMYYKIRNYHEKYISIYTPEKKREQLVYEMKTKSPLKPIPPVIRQFFILFVQQISGLCKKQLVFRIEAEAHTQLGQEEFDLMERIEDEEFKITSESKTKKARKIDDLLILPPEDDEKHSEIDGDKLYVQVRFGHMLKLIHDACANIFKPISDEVFSSVVMLNNLGYYDRIYTKKEEKLLKSDKIFRRWYHVIQTCESLKDIEIIHDYSSKAAAADLLAIHGPKGDKNEINRAKLLSKDEADELKTTIDNNVEKFDHVSDLIYQAKEIDFSHKETSFGNSMVFHDIDQYKASVRDFERKTKQLIERKTNWFILTFNKVKGSIVSIFNKFKKQIVTKDETTVLGKIAAFLHRHEKEITVVILALHLLIIFL